MVSSIDRRSLMFSAAALGGSFLLSGCGGGGSDGGGAIALPPNLNQSASSKPELSLFVEAVAAADLTATLDGSGPFTVFAPNNNAFTALLAELNVSKDALFADKALLGAVLKYHVLSSLVLKANIPLGKAIVPLGGGFFKIENQNGDFKVTDGRNRVSGIVSTDSLAINGVLHVVDRVLLPANKDIVQTAQATPTLSILVEAVVAAGLVNTLKGTGPFTVFAPTNDAFAALLVELGVTKDALLADTALLTRVLTYHVIPARVLKAEIPLNSPITTVQGQTITINSSLQIIDQKARTSAIVATDIFNTNGVVHLIDKVLLPA
ncbi:MAG: fasciclin domain-containing protein [Gammaproteobacteria bacterium]|nr:fasciclin domain-containing protein [Gammaproteobacteria bacterium]